MQSISGDFPLCVISSIIIETRPRAHHKQCTFSECTHSFNGYVSYIKSHVLKMYPESCHLENCYIIRGGKVCMQRNIIFTKVVIIYIKCYFYVSINKSPI